MFEGNKQTNEWKKVTIYTAEQLGRFFRVFHRETTVLFFDIVWWRETQIRRHDICTN